MALDRLHWRGQLPRNRRPSFWTIRAWHLKLLDPYIVKLSLIAVGLSKCALVSSKNPRIAIRISLQRGRLHDHVAGTGSLRPLDHQLLTRRRRTIGQRVSHPVLSRGRGKRSVDKIGCAAIGQVRHNLAARDPAADIDDQRSRRRVRRRGDLEAVADTADEVPGDVVGSGRGRRTVGPASSAADCYCRSGL